MPSLEDAINVVSKKHVNNLFTNHIGVIKAVNLNTMTCDVQVSINRRYLDGEEYEFPLLSDVPLLFPRTNDGIFYIPVNVGDCVLLSFCMRDINVFKNLNQTQSKENLTPNSARKYDINDAVAIVGVLPKEDGFKVPEFAGMRMQYKSGLIELDNDNNLNILMQNQANITSVDDNITITTQNANVVINAQSGDVTINATNVNLNAQDVSIDGDLSVSGSVTATGEVTGNGVDLSSHTHGGVTTGGASTLPPN